MKIGIDIDNTLVSTSESFDRLVKKYSIDFKKKYSDIFITWTEEERDIIFKKYLREILINAEFKDGAVKALKELSSLGNKLYIITARRNHYCLDIEEATLKIIKDNDIKIEEIYFGQNKKSDVAKMLNLDLMIDDDIKVYDNMIKEGIDCILFGDKIKTWKEVLEYINRKEW